MRTDPLAGFDVGPFTHDGVTHPVWRSGAGPAVVIMPEIPGMTPQVMRFARRVRDEGFTVFVAELFGTPGERRTLASVTRSLARVCVSAEFTVLAQRRSSPVTHWLRALCRDAFSQCGGAGVGAIGMCITGNFALSLMVEPCVMAPVLSQPSTPFPVSRAHRCALSVSDDDLAVIRRRACHEGAGVLGLRFTHDAMVPAERFVRLRDELGDGFEGIEIDSGPGNPHGIPWYAHSVVTNDLVDAEGHPTRAALDRVLAVFRERLLSPAAAGIAP